MCALKYLYYFLIFFLLLITCSCEKELTYNGSSENNPRLVINAFITTPDSIAVEISKSASVFTNEVPEITRDATVQIYEADHLIAHFNHIKNGVYQPDKNLVFKTGIQYKIIANAPNVEPVVAYQTIPTAVDFNVSVNFIPETLEAMVNCSFQFVDNASEENYYAIRILRIDTIFPIPQDPTYFNIKKKLLQGYSPDPSIENLSNELDKLTHSYVFLMTDKLFNGQPHNTHIYLDERIHKNQSKNLLVEFISLTKDYYQHMLTKHKSKLIIKNPFSQSVQIHSNIQNGIGIFGGYGSIQKTITVVYSGI